MQASPNFCTDVYDERSMFLLRSVLGSKGQGLPVRIIRRTDRVNQPDVQRALEGKEEEVRCVTGLVTPRL